MNQASPSSPAASPGTRCFFIEMLGFPDAEKSLLSSTFRLTGRRLFSYTEPAAPNVRPDVYLINADHPSALKLLEERAPNAYAPAVLIGKGADPSEWPIVERPIHWMRLFEQLDLVMQSALMERARRQLSVQGSWDGKTYRRAKDKSVVAEPVYVDTKSVESVLVVDDSATVRAFMRAKLTPFRFDVDFAESGEQAIDMAQAKAYTCIFLDILMPGIDGFQVCKRLKSSPVTKSTAVVMLSSKSGKIDRFRGSWAGCDAYLGKPVTEDELLSTIARFLPSARKVAHAMLSANA